MVVGGYPPDDCGGTEVFTQILSEGLLQKYGCQVTVLCMGEARNISFINGVKVCREKINDIRVCRNFSIIYFINKILHMYNPFNKAIFRRVILREKPDIIHIHMLRMFSPSIVSVAKKMNIPVVQTLHELYSLWNFNPFLGRTVNNLLNSRPTFFVNWLREKQRHTLSNVKAVTAPSSFALNAYESFGYYRFSEKEIIPNAFPYNLEKIRQIYRRKKRALYKQKKVKFLFVGRLVPEKGIQLLLDVFKTLELPSVELFFMGNGPLKDQIIQAARSDLRIHYLGFLSGKEKNAAIEKCNVLILPSSSTLFPETFGLVLLEAYMHGLPCIASNKGGIPEVVVSGKTGLLIQPNSFLELKNAILHFSHPENIRKTLPYCYEKLKQYNYDNMLNDYLSVYNHILK